MNIKSLFISIQRFLFSNVNKQFLVFMFFLFLSGIFWLMMTLNETFEQEIVLPVQISGVPHNVVLTSAQQQDVKVVVRDKGWVIMGYLYGEERKPINISFRHYDLGSGRGAVNAADTKRLLEQSLEVSSKIVAIKPEHLSFSYNNGQRKRVPVLWAGRVIPDHLFFISQVKYSSDSVDIYASQGKLDSIRAIYTEPLNYVNFRDTLQVECKLTHPSDVKVVPDHIRVSFYTDVLTEEVIENVPVQCINLPKGKVLRTFPSKVKIHFVAGVSQIRSLHPENFLVVADYAEIQRTQGETCKIYLRHVPHGVSRATLNQNEVDYVIEEDNE
jgi:hypothetical protein